MTPKYHYCFSFNNIAFRIKTEARDYLLPDYLYMFFNHDEFDSYAIIHSWGSATELFTFDEMCDIVLPLPPIEASVNQLTPTTV